MGHQAYWIDNADSAYAYLSPATGSEEASAFLDDGVTHAAGHATGSTSAPLNGQHGLHFDLVLSDIHMPGKMNGIDLALALRASHVDLPVILVTGYASELERARLAHVQVLSKPFDVEVLESLIHEVSMAPARDVPVANSLS